MSGVYAVPLYTHRSISASAAFLIHVAMFLLGSAVFSQSAQYGIERGQGGMEVHLTAAPTVIKSIQTLEVPKEEAVVIDKSSPAEPLSLPKQEAILDVIGDGSSPIPGKDTTTLHTAGGAETIAQPNYLRNLAPRYPEKSRKARQQGIVILLAKVDSLGRADNVQLKSSSGYSLLDEAALKAVQHWTFNPARIGPMSVDSQVEIPIRFQLDKN